MLSREVMTMCPSNTALTAAIASATRPLLRIAPVLCAAALCVSVQAAEPPVRKSVKPSASTATKPVVLTTRSITANPAGPVFGQVDRTSELLKPPVTSSAAPPNACSTSASSLCYDYRTGRAVFRPTKHLLPPVPGLKPESITLKRDRLALNYSF
jgi:hypothetical protein